MSRLAACPKCRNQFSLPELAGPATIACPFCQAHITIKVKAAAPPPAMVVQPAMAVARAMPADDEDEEEEEEEESPRPKKKKKKKKGAVSSGTNETGMKVAIVGGILLLTLLSIVFAFWWFMKGDGSPKVIMPSDLQNRSQSRNSNEEGEEVAEASGTEKFEISEKKIVNQDFFRSYNPTANLPGLQYNKIDDKTESLASDILNRVKQATVYIQTERDDGGGTGSGFFACERGLVVTNAHVVGMLGEDTKEPKSCRVYMNYGASNQKDYKVISFKVDRKNDLAILKLAKHNEKEYPEPLQLASSQTTRETQKVYSLGYPFGNSAGKEVTVTPLSVSSLRYQEGRINVVQFAGAMNPGNSGGPIVDATGRIVSVAVRIMTERGNGGTITNTGISMGVPADEVAALHFGRADRLDVYPPVRRGGKLELPLTLRMTEHGNAMSPRIKVQTGEEKTTPGTPDGSSDAHELAATNAKKVYGGSIQLPDLEKDKVYWLHPLVMHSDDVSTWNKPLAFKPGNILDDKDLPALSSDAPKQGELVLQQRYYWTLNSRGGQRNCRLDYEATTAGGKTAIKDYKVGARVEDQAIPHQYLTSQLWTNRMDESDTYAGGLKMANLLKANFNSWHAVSDLQLPKEALAVGKSWKTTARTVTVDYLYGFDNDTKCTFQCDYLGSYGEGSKLIGVVRVQGEVTDSNSNASAGRISGLALIDGNTREMLDLMIRCDIRKRASGNSTLDASTSMEGFMQLRLQRKGS
jgi:S1-C subfamily serine protease